MKVLTLTLALTAGVTMPAALPGSPAFGPFAGFRLTVQRLNGTSPTVLPVEDKVTWTIRNFVEGGEYSLTVESVDSNGRVINGLPPAVFNVPGAQPQSASVYKRVDTYSMDWADQV